MYADWGHRTSQGTHKLNKTSHIFCVSICVSHQHDSIFSFLLLLFKTVLELVCLHVNAQQIINVFQVLQFLSLELYFCKKRKFKNTQYYTVDLAKCNICCHSFCRFVATLQIRHSYESLQVRVSTNKIRRHILPPASLDSSQYFHISFLI